MGGRKGVQSREAAGYGLGRQSDGRTTPARSAMTQDGPNGPTQTSPAGPLPGPSLNVPAHRPILLAILLVRVSGRAARPRIVGSHRPGPDRLARRTDSPHETGAAPELGPSRAVAITMRPTRSRPARPTGGGVRDAPKVQSLRRVVRFRPSNRADGGVPTPPFTPCSDGFTEALVGPDAPGTPTRWSGASYRGTGPSSSASSRTTAAANRRRATRPTPAPGRR